MRVYQGMLQKGQYLFNMSTGKKLKVPRIVRMHSDDMEDIDEAAWARARLVMHIEWVFQPQIIICAAVVSAVLTLAFGFIGTWRALGHKAAPLLRND